MTEENKQTNLLHFLILEGKYFNNVDVHQMDKSDQLERVKGTPANELNLKKKKKSCTYLKAVVLQKMEA